MAEKQYTTIFEEESEGLKITLALDNEIGETNSKNFNLSAALMELSNQLAQEARKVSKNAL